MLDMYSKDPLFSKNMQNRPMTEFMNYSDSNTYYLEHGEFPKNYATIYGSPRYRLFNVKQYRLKNQFFFIQMKLFYGHAILLIPSIKWGDAPCYFVLRNYKFTCADRAEYEGRIREENFYNGSHEYNVIMEKITATKEWVCITKEPVNMSIPIP